MQVALWEIVLLMTVIFAMCVSCFILGAFVVYRTKREAYEPMFGRSEPQGDAVVLDDFPGGTSALNEEEQADAAADLMDRFEEQNIRFLSQMAKDKQGGVNG